MKKFNFLILIGIISLFFISCSSVKKAFDPQRKNSSEEFLVEKKLPLSMPPQFNKLPIPSNTSLNEGQDQSEDIELLITEKFISENGTDSEKNSDRDFEEFLLDKINK